MSAKLQSMRRVLARDSAGTCTFHVMKIIRLMSDFDKKLCVIDGFS